MRNWLTGRLPVALRVMVALTSGIVVGRVAQAATMTSRVSQAFAFPVTAANGLMADLVMPAGSATNLRFDSGKVAIGELPVALPVAYHRPRRPTREFVRPADIGSRARLSLAGVVDGDGRPVTNTGNQLVIDAVVSPGSAASAAPPFVIPFDIANGTAFVDARLPIRPSADGGARVQVLGVSLVDPDGQPFGVLGFQLPPPRATPGARPTPRPGRRPPDAGQCFVGADCTGVAFRSTREHCCRAAARPDQTQEALSWCPADQFDASTGQCAASMCVPCVSAPPAGHTPTPGPCNDATTCGGACSTRCADGTTSAGQCVRDRMDHCACSADCGPPAPCGGGQCFDTIAFRCTGQPCSATRRCPLPNQFCDLSGSRCSCAAPPPQQGRVCCQCKDGPRACVDLSFADVQPVCPAGCETFVGHECDAGSDRCVPLTPCASDADCDDGNGCTIDHCGAAGCTHDCVCVGPRGCGVGGAPRP
jgi:hypothetical protein